MNFGDMKLIFVNFQLEKRYTNKPSISSDMKLL